MNTRFEYLYRDGSNYKQWGEIVFAGAPSDGLSQRLTRSLESTEFFIADQIRIPEVFPHTWPVYRDDHCWHAFSAVSATEDAPDDPWLRTFEEFVAEVESVSAIGWNVCDPEERVRRRSRRSSVPLPGATWIVKNGGA